jgi:hypothetical protein
LLIKWAVLLAVLVMSQFTITLAEAATSTPGVKFDKLQNSELVDLLSNLKVLVDYRFQSNLEVKVMQATYGYECDPDREAATCPRSELLIVLTSEMAPPSVWRSPRRIGWRTEKPFKGIETNNNFDPSNLGHLRFFATVCEAPEDVETGKVNPRVGGWWTRQRYSVDVSVNGVNLRRATSKAPEENCDLY